MLLFGHVGITTGLVKICQELVTRSKSGSKEACLNSQSSTTQYKKLTLWDNIRNKTRTIDYRFVLIGALLPDIIDKPLWIFTGTNFPWDGRGYAHTFLFSFLLLIGGLILVNRWNKTWLITIAICSFIHLVFDQMWLSTTLWWPVTGSIERGATEGWVPSLLHGLVSNPYVYISESVGFIITLYISLRLIMSKRVIHFLKTGDIDWTTSSSGNKIKEK